MGRVHIVSDGTPKGSRVEVDGVPLEGVRRVQFDLDAGSPAALVTMEVWAGDIDATFDEWVLTKPEADHPSETCHCGRPPTYGYNGDPTHTRGLCEDCDSVRCDAYPLDCPHPSEEKR